MIRTTASSVGDYCHGYTDQLFQSRGALLTAIELYILIVQQRHYYCCLLYCTAGLSVVPHKDIAQKGGVGNDYQVYHRNFDTMGLCAYIALPPTAWRRIVWRVCIRVVCALLAKRPLCVVSAIFRYFIFFNTFVAPHCAASSVNTRLLGVQDLGLRKLFFT